MPYEKDPDEIGALWEKESPNGKHYFTGDVNGEKIVVFQNKTTNERAPQWKIFKSKPREPKPAPPITDEDRELGF